MLLMSAEYPDCITVSRLRGRFPPTYCPFSFRSS